jgi:hypothetical protein
VRRAGAVGVGNRSALPGSAHSTGVAWGIAADSRTQADPDRPARADSSGMAPALQAVGTARMAVRHMVARVLQHGSAAVGTAHHTPAGIDRRPVAPVVLPEMNLLVEP